MLLSSQFDNGTCIPLFNAETCQNLSCWTCTGIVTLLFIAGLGIGFFILLTHPNPTVTTLQGVASGDTVPLYYASKTEIPQGGSKIWYESLTISIDNTEAVPSEMVVSVSFVKANYLKGAQPCSPPAGNDHTESRSFPLELNYTQSISTKPFYFTNGATFSLNFTITASPNGSTLSVYVLDSFDDYECLRKRTCSPDNPMNFEVSNGSQESLSKTISISSYYFIVFASDDNIQGNCTYEATSQYYNYTDYSDRIVSSCNVTQEKACTLSIGGNFDECAFAYTATGSTNFIPLKVVAHHRRFNVISIVFLALFVASLTLVTTGLLTVFIMTCFKRQSNKSGYSKLT